MSEAIEEQIPGLAEQLFGSVGIGEDQQAALALVNHATLIEWWRTLNGWQWPEALPDPEPITQDPFASAISARAAIMHWIETEVGLRAVLRAHNASMTDQQFEDFWLGHYEGDEEALERDQLRVAMMSHQPLPRNAEGKFGRVNAHESPTAMRLRIVLDGEDISDDCYEADDVAGYVLCYVYEELAPGERTVKQTVRGQLDSVRREGNVVIIEPVIVEESPGASDTVE